MPWPCMLGWSPATGGATRTGDLWSIHWWHETRSPICNCGWVPGYEVGYGSVLRDQVVVKDQNDEVHKVSESPGNEMLLPKQMGSLGCFGHG